MISLRQIQEQYNTQEACMALLVELRWPDGVRCPRCDNEKVFRIARRNWTWVCKSGKETVNEQTGEVWICHKKNGYRFSALVATVFENTNYPLPVWFEVIYLICQSKKGMSVLQIQRMLKEAGRSTAYKTAFYICHRVRAMLDNGNDFTKLMGQVEIDEAYIGGKEKNKHRNKRIGAGGGSVGKTPVIGAISRKGNVVCQIIENTTTKTLNDFVRKTVSDKVDLVATDDYGGYRYLNALGYPHETVNHSDGEYVRGLVHSANLDSFWALLKRGIVGTYHNVSKKYLPLYLNEFSWRHNNRKNPDIFKAALAGC